MALDHGLNYLDTAPAYGNTLSEQGYAKVIAARKRDSFFLNTKVSLWDLNRSKIYQDIFQSLPEPEQAKLKTAVRDEIEKRKVFDPDYIIDYFASQRSEVEQSILATLMERKYGRQIDRGKNYKQIMIDSLEQSLQRLGTDHVDLLMCPHGASSPEELLQYPEIFDGFEVLRKAGKARFLGVSSHNDPGGVLSAAAKSGQYAVAMVAYSIINHNYVDAGLDAAKKADMGVIAMKVARPVFNGRNNGLVDRPERVAKIEAAIDGPLKRPMKAYTWALRNPKLTAVVSEMGNADITRDNLGLAAAKKV
jgi:aryl-alcohol dehydrogenase-like predicted oxidoreductase